MPLFAAAIESLQIGIEDLDVAGEVSVRDRRITTIVRSGMSDAKTDAACECLLQIHRVGQHAVIGSYFANTKVGETRGLSYNRARLAFGGSVEPYGEATLV